MPLDFAAAKNIANVLTEALPYIQKFTGCTIVVKYGGNAMTDEVLKNSFARDIVLMKLVGMNPVVVHGGGPQIGSLLTKLDIQSEFIDGIRVTDSKTMDVVEMVLGGLVNKEIVSLLNKNQGKAIGITGKDGNLIQAKKLLKKSSIDSKMLDMGQVGSIEKINREVLDILKNSDFIPVIAPIGTDRHGNTYNINADTAAGALAEALGAQKLVYMTDIAGVRGNKDDASSLLRQATTSQLRSLLGSGAIDGGMIPKIESCVSAIERGVFQAHILDGRIAHVLLLELFTDAGVGTMVSKG